MQTDFEKIGFSDKFMFGKIMSNPEICKEFLEQILDMDIDHIEYLEREKELDDRYDGHGVRLDIYAEDGHTVYDCEMQTANPGNLPKRSRYYQGKIDSEMLARGFSYSSLKNSIVIFICRFDPFGAGRYVYTFSNLCNEKTDIGLNDGTLKVFINTKGSIGDVTEEFKELIRFVDTSEDCIYSNDLANRLLDELKKIRSNEEWRHDYMTWKDLMDDTREEGREEGRKEGIEEKALDISKKMITLGFTPETIAEVVGLPITEVIKLKAN